MLLPHTDHGGLLSPKTGGNRDRQWQGHFSPACLLQKSWLPARPHVPQLLEIAPSKRPASHTSDKRTDQQPSPSQMPDQPCRPAKPLNVAVAKQPVMFHSHRALSQNEGKACPSLPVTFTSVWPTPSNSAPWTVLFQQWGQVAASNKHCLLVQTKGPPCILTCYHLCHCLPASRVSAVSLTSKVSPTFCGSAGPQKHAHDMN